LRTLPCGLISTGTCDIKSASTHRGQGGRLVRQPRRLPESVDVDDVAVFLADLNTHRDRAMVLAMLQGGLRAAEVRGLTLAGVDFGLRQVRVTGKGGRERIVPVDRAFFTELASYLRAERPAGLATQEVFVMLRGPTCGQPMTEAGMRKIFRTHRDSSGAVRVRPHRLRHTYGTELEVRGVASDASTAECVMAVSCRSDAFWTFGVFCRRATPRRVMAGQGPPPTLVLRELQGCVIQFGCVG